MDNLKLLEEATKKATSIGKLAEALDWHKGSIAAIKRGAPMPAHRAAQLAEYLGKRPEVAYLTTLESSAATEFEKKLLGKLLRACKSAAAVLTIATMPVLTAFQPGKLEFPGVPGDSAGIYIMNKI